MAKVIEIAKARDSRRKRRERIPNSKVEALIDSITKLSVLLEEIDGDLANLKHENLLEPDGAS